jgi:hypothetical protein
MSKPRTSRRLEIERRLALFYANRPMMIAQELGVSKSYIHEIAREMRETPHAHSTARATAQEGDSKPLVKGP